MVKMNMQALKASATTGDTTPSRLAQLGQVADAAIRRAVSRHPQPPTQAVDVLRHDADRATRQAVVKNPNTPVSALRRPGAQFPMALLDNPALVMLRLENPALILEISEAPARSECWPFCDRTRRLMCCGALPTMATSTSARLPRTA